MPSIFLVDKQEKLVYLNQEAERAFRLDRALCLGQAIWDIFPGQADSIYARLYQQALASNETTQLPVFAECLNGWFVFKLFPSPEGMLGCFVASQEQEVTSPFKQLAQVALQTSLSVIITDAKGATEWVNEGFTKQTGYTLADMLGKKPGQVLQGPDTESVAVRRCRERLVQQVPFSFTILNYTKKGHKLWYHNDINPVRDEAGKLTHYIAVQQNITLRKEAEASQAALKQKLYLQNQDLQQFAYAVAHELQAPLATAQVAIAQLVHSDKALAADDTTLAALHQDIEQATSVLQNLNSVLALQDTQAPYVQTEPVLLSAIGEQAIAEFQEALHQCGGRVLFDSEPQLALQANRDYLYIIFHSLLANAIKCRSEERPLRITIHCYASVNQKVIISFADNGTSFDRYKAGADGFQLYKHFHSKPQSQGVELFLAKAYADAMGGQIEVSSSVGIGTNFLLHFDAMPT